MTKTLLLDIETAPSLGYIWGKYEQDVLEFEKHWYILCYSWKWLDQKRIFAKALPDFPRYKKDKEDDKELMEHIWWMLDEADVVIAHNGDRFDIRKINARFAAHGMRPPSPYQTVDTLKVARRYFKFDSNRLDDLGQYLGLGRKEDAGSFRTWRGCMLGERDAWRRMVKYNKQDVNLLEDVYLHLRPWMTNHPNTNVLTGALNNCPICGSEKLHSRGFSITRVSKKRRFQCQDCGGWSTGKPEKVTDIR